MCVCVRRRVVLLLPVPAGFRGNVIFQSSDYITILSYSPSSSNVMVVLYTVNIRYMDPCRCSATPLPFGHPSDALELSANGQLNAALS